MTAFGPYKATVVKIHDGDTLDVDLLLFPVGKVHAGHEIDLGFNVWRTPEGTKIRNQSVRLNGCNAAELATPAGKAALAYIETLVKVGDTVTLNGRDLAGAMIAAGQAAPWNGQGTKPVPA